MTDRDEFFAGFTPPTIRRLSPPALAVGDEVVITGMGFAGVRGVVVETDVRTPFGLCHKVERGDGTGTGLFEPCYLRPAAQAKRRR